MKQVLLFTLSFFLFISCDTSGTKIKSTLNIMPLGDSLTYDEANAYYAQGKDIMTEGKRKAYRADLAYMLKDAEISFNFVGSRHSGYDIEPPFDPDNEGYPGWSSFEIAKIVYKKLVRNPANIILLHIGTNDNQKGDMSGLIEILDEIDRFEKDFDKKITVYIALIINRRYHDYVIDIYNHNLNIIVQRRIDSGDKLKLVNMTHILQGEDYLENTHPNAQGYKKMADAWFDILVDDL